MTNSSGGRPDDTANKLKAKVNLITELRASNLQHDFIVTSFSKLRTCDHCTRFLWGFFSQGFVCQACEFVVHPECLRKVSKQSCGAKEFSSVDIDRFAALSRSSSSRVAQTKMLREASEPQSSQEKPTDVVQGESVGSSSTAPDSLAKSMPRTPTKPKFRPVVASDSAVFLSPNQEENPAFGEGLSYEPEVQLSSEAHDKFVEEVIQNQDKWDEEILRIRKQPALNVLTTSMQNLAAFLPRITYLRLAYEELVKVFTWERPLHTIISLLCYTCLCLRPVWLVLIPFFAAWMSLFFVYDPPSSDTGDLGVNYFIPLQYRSTILGGDVDKANETAIEYALNAQFLQNVLGIYVLFYNLIYDGFIRFKSRVGPFWPAWFTALGLPPALAAYYFVSPRYSFLALGWACFLSTHPLFLAIGSTLSNRVFVIADACLLVSKFLLKSKGLDVSFLKEASTHSIEIFENQRWWAVSGWNGSTIATERAHWSDESGLLSQTSPSEQALRIGYVWEKNSEWEVVKSWCHPMIPDPEGWIYYNNFWERPCSSPRFDCFTRRRLWRRIMVEATSEVNLGPN